MSHSPEAWFRKWGSKPNAENGFQVIPGEPLSTRKDECVGDMSGWTTASKNAQREPLTIEGLSTLMLNWFDRTPAMCVGIAIHPNFEELFMANMREEGFYLKAADAKAVPDFLQLPIVIDDKVPFGEYRLMYQHTFSRKIEDEI